MTFEEFFKKKRIDLAAFEKAEPVLFAEFKAHFEQMGEKSFDHTKKYWFNKLRRQYQLAPEIKTEKPHIANPLAEQTITESLEEMAPAPSPKMGFTPKFKAANAAKPASEEKKEEEMPAPSPAKIGFIPKFRAANTPKSVSEEKKEDNAPAPNEPISKPTENTASKPTGFVPRFKMKPKSEDEQEDKPA